jgi:hypothetical protein
MIRSTVFTFFIATFVIGLCLLSSCRLDKKNTEIQLSEINKVYLLDSAAASKAIVKDDIDKFFERITPIDMMIQTKTSYPPSISRDSMVSAYKKYVQADVGTFTPSEAAFIAKTMSEAYNLCNKVSGKIFPEEIKIVKTHGKHYGDDTYYTRENLIIIPQQSLKARDSETFLKVILHEISHIVTRLRPSLKSKLYATIGFNKMANPLIIKDSLKNRLLTNPDGSDLDWVTELTTTEGKNVYTIPLIYANDSIYNPQKPDFFQNMGWNYFELTPSVSSKEIQVITIGDKQKSTLNTTGLTTLFKEKYNTEYIIHPDEIVADNFSILFYSLKNPKSLDGLSAGGKVLIETMKGVLK